MTSMSRIPPALGIVLYGVVVVMGLAVAIRWHDSWQAWIGVVATWLAIPLLRPFTWERHSSRPGHADHPDFNEAWRP